MIVPFLEFDFLWEKFIYTLVNTNCTFTGKCSFHKKEFTKSIEEIGKVTNFFSPLTENPFTKEYFLAQIDTSSIFALTCLPKTVNFTMKVES